MTKTFALLFVLTFWGALTLMIPVLIAPMLVIAALVIAADFDSGEQ